MDWRPIHLDGSKKKAGKATPAPKKAHCFFWRIPKGIEEGRGRSTKRRIVHWKDGREGKKGAERSLQLRKIWRMQQLNLLGRETREKGQVGDSGESCRGENRSPCG